MKPIDAEDLFLTNLSVIDRAIGYVCHRNRIDRDEGEEFGSYVKFKLIETNYSIIRKFEGRSSFSTYMTTVIGRMYFQYRVQMWGKWRPSAEAKRLGDKGITVERLLTRDGYTHAEVISILTCGSDPAFSNAEIEAICVRLPVRQPRPVLVSTIDNADNVAAIEAEPFSSERCQKARHTAAAVDAAIALMEPEDQLIVKMRFWAGRKVSEIGRAVGIDGKKLYKRITKLLSQLKLALDRAGIDAVDITELLHHTDHDLSFELPKAEGKAEFRHSKPVDGLGEA